MKPIGINEVRKNQEKTEHNISTPEIPTMKLLPINTAYDVLIG